MRSFVLIYVIFVTAITAILTALSTEKGMTIAGCLTIGVTFGVPMFTGGEKDHGRG